MSRGKCADPKTDGRSLQPNAHKHGAYSSQIRQRYSDGRTSEGKLLKQVMGELEKELGEIGAGQSIILSNIRSKMIVLLQISAFMDKQINIIDEGTGSLLPVLGHNYLAFTEALRRDILCLYDLANKKPTKQDVDLSSYLATTYKDDDKKAEKGKRK